MNRNLTDIELSMVCEVIASRMGLHFPVERWAMLRRNLVLASREFGFHDMDSFIQWLLSASLNSDQVEILAAHLTISETYFWREPKVFTALTDFILPELIRSKEKEKVEELATNRSEAKLGEAKSRFSGREKSIRIWSAGCSTGEEPYSIAIALYKTIPKIEDWNITILATDINPRALRKAMNGTYGAWSFRNSPAWLKINYFLHKEDRQYEIIHEIKKMVTFSCLSLAEMSAISNANTMDIIFCRNVLMYFTPEWISKISNSFYKDLTEDGWFIVSSCELSSQVFPQFTAVNFPGAVLYRKDKNGSSHSLYATAVSKEEIQPLSTEAFFATKASEKVEVMEDLRLLSSEASAKENLQKTAVNLKPVEESVTDRIFSIRLLADQGHLEEALSICQQAITSDKLVPGLYFLRGSILQELGKNTEAIMSLKQAIYIDPDYIMGHFMLGNLFARQGNSKSAKRFFDNVLGLLHKYENNDILPESEGLSAEYLREIIFSNMNSIRTK
jgi:chemotaxis protein methyltransferase CheR